jgi:hypothetical protein
MERKLLMGRNPMLSLFSSRRACACNESVHNLQKQAGSWQHVTYGHVPNKAYIKEKGAQPHDAISDSSRDGSRSLSALPKMFFAMNPAFTRIETTDFVMCQLPVL